VQLGVRHRPLLKVLALPDDRRLVAARRLQVPVDAVVRDVEISADEPFHVRGIPLAHGRPRLEPLQFPRVGLPERIGVLRVLPVKRVVAHHRLRGEGIRRRKLTLLM
jgi:hypothetical protein